MSRGSTKVSLPKPASAERGTDATIAVAKPALWISTPGWGIAADLIPPELINARKLTLLRKLMAVGIAAILLACAGGYYLAARESTAAAEDLVSIQDRTRDLQAVSRGFSDVVTIQGSVTQVQSQIAQVMAADVDLVALMSELESNLPATMTITQEAITVSLAAVASADTAATPLGLDNSGLPRIGTITISGTGQTLNDLSDYVDRLRVITGLVDVFPISNTSATSEAGGSTQYSLTIGLTDALLSHRFDVGAGR